VSVLVIAEQRGGTLNRATWEAVAAAQQASSPVRIAVVGSDLVAETHVLGLVPGRSTSSLIDKVLHRSHVRPHRVRADNTA